MREKINAKIVKVKMRDPNIVSKHFLSEEQEKMEVLKCKSCLAISMDAKKRMERRKSLI